MTPKSRFLLGQGESGKVYALSPLPSASLAIKVFNNKESYHREVAFRRYLKARLPNGSSYAAVEYGMNKSYPQGFIVTPRFYPIEPKDVRRVEKRLVRLIFQCVAAGLLHNDLHWKNVMQTAAGDPVLIDFDLSAVVRPPAEKIDTLALLLGQLYMLVDSFNDNNKKFLSFVDGIVDLIYQIRTSMKASVRAF